MSIITIIFTIVAVIIILALLAIRKHHHLKAKALECDATRTGLAKSHLLLYIGDSVTDGGWGNCSRHQIRLLKKSQMI